jgi:predicted transposase YbfD/YdcC
MVENGLRWVMDVTFRDDQCRIRTDHAPANFTTIKHMALNLIQSPGKGLPPTPPQSRRLG